jgi:hypothetical protein
MEQLSMSHSSTEADKPSPWWRFPIVWMVVGGPALVVVAALATAVIAYTHVDPVMDPKAQAKENLSHAPALQGRNHAAEEVVKPAEH